MRDKNIKRKIVLILVAFLLLSVIVLSNDVTYIIGSYNGQIEKIGIIDDCLTSIYSDKVFYYGELYENDKKTHGDELVQYIIKRGYSGEVYFYSALNKYGDVDSDSIIEGLEWMKEHNIKRVNISLSSKRKSNELQEWIKDNEEVQIYCSYNNKDNTYDYPAMLAGVTASGANKYIEYKPNDCKYNSNRIVIFNKGIHLFYGNSYLSMETLLTHE